MLYLQGFQRGTPTGAKYELFCAGEWIYDYCRIGTVSYIGMRSLIKHTPTIENISSKILLFFMLKILIIVLHISALGHFSTYPKSKSYVFDAYTH